MFTGKVRLGNASTRKERKGTAWRAIAGVVLVGSLLATTAVPSVGAQDAEPLRIGALLPFTGDLSDFGPGFLNAAQLAVDEINAGGGVNGQPIELVQGDTASSPQQAVEEARRLIEIEGVPAIVGPPGSGEALPVVESVAGPAGVLVVTSSATSPALTVANDDDFLFRTPISDAAQGVVMADLAIEQGYQTACVMYVNNAYGQGLSEAFSEQFTALGGTVTAQVPHEQEQASYASELATCTEAGPDVLIGAAYPESGRVFLRELVEGGDAPSIIFSDGLKSPDLFAELGWEPFAGGLGTASSAPDSDAGAAFEAAWEAAYGGELPALPYLKELYDAVYVIALAAEQADSIEGAAIRDVLREVANEPATVVSPGIEGWQAAVAAIDGGEDIDYQGASGTVDFDENGDISQGVIEIWQIEGEEILTAETRDVDLSAAGAATPAATPAA